MTETSESWAAVGMALQAQMSSLGMIQKDLCNATGFSAETVRPFMQGKPNTRRRSTRAKICLAVGWREDSIDRILAGGRAMPLAINPDLRPATRGDSFVSSAEYEELRGDLDEMKRIVAEQYEELRLLLGEQDGRQAESR